MQVYCVLYLAQVRPWTPCSSNRKSGGWDLMQTPRFFHHNIFNIFKGETACPTWLQRHTLRKWSMQALFLWVWNLAQTWKVENSWGSIQVRIDKMMRCVCTRELWRLRQWYKPLIGGLRFFESDHGLGSWKSYIPYDHQSLLVRCWCIFWRLLCIYSLGIVIFLRIMNWIQGFWSFDPWLPWLMSDWQWQGYVAFPDFHLDGVRVVGLCMPKVERLPPLLRFAYQWLCQTIWWRFDRYVPSSKP